MAKEFKRLLEIVSEILGITISEATIKNEGRKHIISFSRKVISFILYFYEGYTLQEISTLTNRTHSTTLHNINTILNMVELGNMLKFDSGDYGKFKKIYKAYTNKDFSVENIEEIRKFKYLKDKKIKASRVAYNKGLKLNNTHLEELDLLMKHVINQYMESINGK